MAPLSETLSAATPKRISEFLAGRFCALKAIQAFQPDWSGQVGMNPDGSPRWPEGLVGSITHTQGFAAAAVAPSDTWLSVGIDSERMADEGILAAAKDIALRDDERRLSPHSPVSENEFILLIFSAKESISKCLYPLTLTKHPLEFADIILDGIDYQGRTFDFHLSKSIKPGILKSCIARGRFEFAYGCVHTGVELQRPVRRIKTGKCS